MNFVVNKQDKNLRIDICLANKYPNLSRSQWQKEIKQGGVWVNGLLVDKHYKVKQGDKIEIKISKTNTKNKYQDQHLGLKKIQIVFENENYLVINKPASVLAHTTQNTKEPSLVGWLSGRYAGIKTIGVEDRSGIVHRLDKDVSGVMLVAKNKKMYDYLKKEFKERRVYKEYLALVHNAMRQNKGELKSYLSRSQKGKFKSRTDRGASGKLALTEYSVVRKYMHFTLLKVSIYTGRTHQIRVHLSSIGHPIVGDKLYATHDVRVKNKQQQIDRLWLVAKSISFKDLSNKQVSYQVEVPDELDNFLKYIK